MNEKLLKKLINEEPLDAAEHLELEQALESGDRSLIAQCLSSQDHIEPSLAWRSSLNEQLRQIAPKPKVSPLRWIGFGGAIAAFAAGCAALVFMVSSPEADQEGTPAPIAQNDKVREDALPKDGLTGPNNSELSNALVTAHQSDMAQASLGVRSPRATMRPATQLGDIDKW